MTRHFSLSSGARGARTIFPENFQLPLGVFSSVAPSFHEYGFSTFARYLEVRCQLPQQARFRLAVVEGFAGGGRYNCGTAGSPLIFIEQLRRAAEAFNLKRSSEGMAALDIECLLILNDEEREAVEFLKTHAEPLLAAIKAEVPKLHLQGVYLSKPFEEALSRNQGDAGTWPVSHVVFNLDQCGVQRC